MQKKRRTVRSIIFALVLLLTAGICLQISAEPVCAAGPLQGKSVLIDGDSIQWSFGKYVESSVRSMGAGYVKNISENAATMAPGRKKSKRKNSTFYRISRIPAWQLQQYDYVILATGTNDYYHFYKTGPGTPDSVDVRTTAGALNMVISAIQLRSPNTKIVVVTPIHRFSGGKNCDFKRSSYSKCTLSDYRAVITATAARYSNVSVIQGTDISRANEMNKKKNSRDGLHPTKSYAKKVLAPRFTFLFCATAL